MRRLWRRYRAVTAAILSALTFGGLVGSDLIRAEELLHALKVGVVAVFAFLITNAAGSLDYTRVILSVLLICFAWITFDTIRYRKKPISIFGSKIVIRFLDPKGDRVNIVREQKIRGNAPNVSAYYMEVSAEYGGKIPRAGITEAATFAYPGFSSNLRLHGNEEKWEVIQRFTPSLPYKWYNTLIPEWLLRLAASFGDTFLPRFVVSRTIAVEWIDEYNKPDAQYYLEAGRYAQRNLTVEVHFYSTRQPRPQSVKAWRVERNGITEFLLNQRNVGGPDPFYHLYIPELRGETLRLFWEF